MKNFWIFTLLLLLSSCGKISPKGEIQVKNYDVEDFVNLDLKGKYRLFYAHSDKNLVQVETYPNISDNLKINTINKTLSITERRATQGVDFYNITVYSRLPLEKIQIADSVEMNISSAIKTDNLRLNLKNNAKFIGAVDSRRAEIEMLNTSRANFMGFTRDATLKIADTASLIAPYWKINHIKIDSRNGNYAEVNVLDSLGGSVRNTAKLLYYNDPVSAVKIDKTTTVTNKILK